MTDEQPAPDPEQERALGKMSFMEHLGELRTRIVWALGSAAVGLVIAFFVTDPAMRFISKPLRCARGTRAKVAPPSAGRSSGGGKRDSRQMTSKP